MLPRILLGASAAIMLALGSIHLLYTFWGNKLLPRDTAVQAAMNATHMMLTKETSLWNAWIGFNASHSIGAIFFGLVYIFLAVSEPRLLFSSLYLQLLGIAVLAGLVVLAKVYWFSIPFAGVGLALACFLAGLVFARMQ